MTSYFHIMGPWHVMCVCKWRWHIKTIETAALILTEICSVTKTSTNRGLHTGVEVCHAQLRCCWCRVSDGGAATVPRVVRQHRWWFHRGRHWHAERRAAAVILCEASAAQDAAVFCVLRTVIDASRSPACLSCQALPRVCQVLPCRPPADHAVELVIDPRQSHDYFRSSDRCWIPCKPADCCRW